MTTSEPTTGDVVRALRCMADDTECKDCRYKYPVGNVILCDHEQMNENAADRLESQERDLERFRAFHERYAEQTSKKYVEDICALTARAEQAERERDAFMKECDTGRTAGYKEGLEEGFKKGRDDGYDTAWKEARYEMNEY